MKPNPTPGPRPRREPINLDRIRDDLLAINSRLTGAALRSTLEIWAGSVIPLSPDDVAVVPVQGLSEQAMRLYIGYRLAGAAGRLPPAAVLSQVGAKTIPDLGQR
jgi:hypothetical protein